MLRLLATFAASTAAATLPAVDQKCKYIPGDVGWPSQRDWQQLNQTVEGRLIATVPLGAVCHDNGEFAAYDVSECAALRTGITEAGPQTL